MDRRLDDKKEMFAVLVFLIIVFLAFSATVAYIFWDTEDGWRYLSDVSLELIGLLLVATLGAVLVTKHSHQGSILSFSIFILALSCMLFMSMVFGIYFDVERPSVLMDMWACTLCFQMAVLYAFAGYTVALFDSEIRYARRIVHTLIIGFLISVAICLSNRHIGTLYTMDSEIEYTTVGLIIVTIMMLIPMVFSVLFTLKHRSTRRMKMLLMLFPASVLTGMIFQAAFGDLMFGVLLTTFGFAFVFSSEFINHEYRLASYQNDLQDRDIRTLSSQLTPHFMFNSLTSIINLPSNNDKSREAIAVFSTYLRNSMDSMGLTTPLAIVSEIRQAETYIELKKLTFGDRLNVIWDIGTDSFMIPSLTIRAIMSQILRKYRDTDVVSLDITVRTEPFGDFSRISLGATAKLFLGHERDVPVIDPEVETTLSDRLELMCNGRIRYIYDVIGSFYIVIDIPEESA